MIFSAFLSTDLRICLSFYPIHNNLLNGTPYMLTCLCYYGSCMSKCLCALGASVLAYLYALRANVPADLGTLHVYVPTFFVCPHVSRSHLSFRTHLPSVSTSMHNCVFMHFISVVSKTLLISDKGTDKEST